MGIEAFCPNGHRMKVKDHLAGRLGVCPTCGVRFRLPDASGGQLQRSDIPIGEPPTQAASEELPAAHLLQLDPAAVAALPIAVPYAAPTPAIDTVPQAVPQAVASPKAVTRTVVPLGQVPLEGLASPRRVPVDSAAQAFFPGGPESPNSDSPPGSSPSEAIAEWATSTRSPRVTRRRVRDDAGSKLAIPLVVIAAIATILAVIILASRGLGR